jgi:simple sugar transport system substrate-binding protein
MKIKKILAAAVSAMMVLGLCACGGASTGSSSGKSTSSVAAKSAVAAESGTKTNVNSPLAGKKVAYVMLLPSSTIFQMWKESCDDLCKKMGVGFDFFFCDSDFNKWQDTIHTCAQAGYDGILVSHGNQDGSYEFLKQIHEQYPKMSIVTFDTQFYSGGEYKKIDGITQMF